MVNVPSATHGASLVIVSAATKGRDLRPERIGLLELIESRSQKFDNVGGAYYIRGADEGYRIKSQTFIPYQ